MKMDIGLINFENFLLSALHRFYQTDKLSRDKYYIHLCIYFTINVEDFWSKMLKTGKQQKDQLFGDLLFHIEYYFNSYYIFDYTIWNS